MSDKPEDRWQSRVTSLRMGFRELYERGLHFDVTLRINNAHEFKAHRLALSARNLKFREVLLDSKSCEDVYDFVDESLTETGVKILLRYIYTYEVCANDENSVIEAYLAADFFRQKTLLQECESRMELWIINKDNVWQLANAGYTIHMLRYKCITYIKNNATDLLASPAFLNISFGCLICLLENEALNVPAMQRLNRIMEWAVNRHTKPVNYALVRQEFIENRILSKLGIETLTCNELTSVITDYQGLLTEREVVQFMIFIRDKDVLCLPDWYDVQAI